MKQSWNHLSATEQHAIKRFNLILEAYEWDDPQGTEHHLTQGRSVYPHATRSSSNRQCYLYASMHTQVSMLSLHIRPHASHVPAIKLHFVYKVDPTRVLEHMVASQDWLHPGQYFRFAAQVLACCEDILVETSDHEIHTFSGK